MASAPMPSPPDPRELEKLRRQADERRRRRERWTPWLTLLIALIVHLLGALFGVWWALRRPPEPPAEPKREARLRFVPPQPQAQEAPEPVESEQISDRDVEAQAPEPAKEPPPIIQPPEPPPQPRLEPKPPTPEPQPEREPEPEPPPKDPTRLTFDEKRERMKDVLRDWSSPSQPSSDPFESLPTIPPDALRGGPDIQFESSADVDWGPYAARIKRIVRTNWRIPTIAQVGGRGGTQLHFYIACDGSIEELEQVVPSGTLPLDVAAENALALSNKLPPPPLPPEYCEERVGVNWSFFYNMSERELRFWYRERAIEQRRQMNGTGP